MLYAILCYNSEEAIGSWSKDYHDETMTKLYAVNDKIAKQGRLGPVARLLPTTAATTLRKGREEMVIDGPFAETKEQLLGFYVIDCASLEAAIDTAKELAKANPGTGSYEIRPVAEYLPSQLPDTQLQDTKKPAA
jgi:hypothetical protein